MTIDPVTYALNFGSAFTKTPEPIAISIQGTEIALLVPSALLNSLEITDMSGSILRSVSFENTYAKMAVTPDFSKAVLWK